MALWLSVALTAAAVTAALVVAGRELAIHRRERAKALIGDTARTRAVILIAFLVAVVVAQFVLFVSVQQGASLGSFTDRSPPWTGRAPARVVAAEYRRTRRR